MDFSRFKRSDWLKVGGALGFLIFGFFDWVTVSFKGANFGGNAGGGNAFDFTWTGVIPWLLIVAVGVLTFLLATSIIKRGNLPWDLIFLAASALATLLVLIRLIFNPLDGKDAFEALGGSVNRAFGLWVCTIAAIVVLVGSFLGFQESGGTLADLKDVNKIKGSFQHTGSTTPPPPPPPGESMPPPPPPPAP